MRNADCGMRNGTNSVFASVLIAVSFLCMGADGGSAITDDQATIQAQQKSLQDRIESLKREQDLLLFQKAMYSTDSKYLLLDTKLKKGQLKYKNRVLKEFTYLTSQNFPGERLKTGKFVLTKKQEGKRDRHALVFGNALVIQWKRATVSPQEADIPFISLTKKEMLSIYFALEEGAMLYVVK